MIYKLAIAAYLALTLTPLLIEFFLRRKTNNISKKYDKSHYKCMFTSVKMNGECKQHIIDKVPCGADCALMLLRDITDLISSATKSVSVCMYLLTCHDISNEIIKSHRDGKKVRVIVDERMVGCTGSQARFLQRHGANCAFYEISFNYKMHVSGIEVKAQKSDGSMMHHKFFLIDEDTPNAKAFIGTANLTLQALCANWEAMVITDDKELIARLKTEFEIMWSAFAIYKRPKIGNRIQE